MRRKIPPKLTHTKHWSQAREAGHEPAMGGIVPGDMTTAITARGGTAEQKKKSIRTEDHTYLQAFPQNKSTKGRWTSSDHSPHFWDWKFLLYDLTQEGKGT